MMTRSQVDSSSYFPPSYTNSSQQTAASAMAYNFSHYGNESESNNTRFNNNNNNPQQYPNYHHHHHHQQGEYCSTESTLIQSVQSNNEFGVKSSNTMQISSNNANDYEMVLKNLYNKNKIIFWLKFLKIFQVLKRHWAILFIARSPHSE